MPVPGFAHTAKQLQAIDLIARRTRHIMLLGGARSGKTFLLCEAIAARAMSEPGSRHAILRFRFNHVKASVWHDTFPKMMRMVFPGVAYKKNKSDYYFELPADDGMGNVGVSEVWIGGLDDKERTEKVLGQEYATILLNECSQIGLSSREIVRTRLAQKTRLALMMLYDENPPLATHWTHRVFIEKRHPESPYEPLEDPENYAWLHVNPKDNAANLPVETLDELSKLAPRQRLRFFEGRFGDATEGALWTFETIERYRVKEAPEDLQRVIVAVDPSGTKGDPEKASDDIGIIVVGLGLNGHAYVLEDCTVQGPPAVWGRVAVTAYGRYLADKLVAEINFGGAMVEHVIKSAAATESIRVDFEELHASRGKVVRAEPISDLYSSGKVHHVGQFADLEDQMMSFTTHGYMGEKSPDRADALVWALTKLFPGVIRGERKVTVTTETVSSGYNPHTGGFLG